MSGHAENPIVASQRASWNSAAWAWEKWDAWLEQNMGVMNDRLLAAAGVAEGHQALDLGSGTGQPALAAARRVGPKGGVTGVDVAGDMLEVARKKARALGYGNVTFHVCDACSLPFEDGLFDAAVSRFCLMFTPDPRKAAREVFRLLRPGGVFAAAVWADSARNPTFTLAQQVLNRYTPVPALSPDAPGVFRMAKPGTISGILRDSGFTQVDEEEAPLQYTYASGEMYFENFMDMAAPLRPLYLGLTPSQRQEARGAMIEEIERYRRGESVEVPGVAIVARGVKPAPA